MSAACLTRRFRLALTAFIFGLVISGLTAFPLRQELDWLASWIGVRSNADLASLSDCSFGVVGVIPLFYCLDISRRLKRMGNCS